MIALIVASALLANAPAKPPTSFESPVPANSTRSRVTEPDYILSGVAVTLECTARANGHVRDCTVLGETHPGLGFGEAAIALMRDAEVAPGPRDYQFARTLQFTP